MLKKLFNPDFSQAKTACEESAFATMDCGKSFDVVLIHLAPLGLSELGTKAR